MDNSITASVGLNIDVLLALTRAIDVGLGLWHVPDPDDIQRARLLFTNPAASRASGADVTSFEGLLIFDAFPMLRDTPLPGVFASVVREQRTVELPDLVYGDETIPEAVYRVTVTPVAVDYLVVQYLNITHQRQAEAELRALNTRLEVEVRDRTRELERRNAVLEQFAFRTAHDLQTPLFSIAGMMGAIEEEVAELGRPDLEMLLSRAMEAAGRLRTQISEMLGDAERNTGPIRPVEPRED